MGPLGNPGPRVSGDFESPPLLALTFAHISILIRPVSYFKDWADTLKVSRAEQKVQVPEGQGVRDGDLTPTDPME